MRLRVLQVAWIDEHSRMMEFTYKAVCGSKEREEREREREESRAGFWRFLTRKFGRVFVTTPRSFFPSPKHNHDSSKVSESHHSII